MRKDKMDSALRDILREEKKRQKGHKDRIHNKPHNNKSHHKSGVKTNHHKLSNHHSKEKSQKKTHRRHKSENDSKSIEFVPVSNALEVRETYTHLGDGNGRPILMFLYEDSEGKLYKNLKSMPCSEEATAKIFPVYVHGSHDNFLEEEIVYKNGQWSSDTESSWLEWMSNPEYELLEFQGEQVVVYNEKLFHCEDDLFQYLQYTGPEVLTVEP